jgi:Uma2 family endonuclease
MAMGTEVITRLTYDEFRQLPDDGKRYELIHGEVHVSPSPNVKHQRTQSNLFMSLGPYINTHRLGWLLLAPLDVALALDTAVQPDLLFISAARADIILDNYIAGAPDLVVEILSPSTAAHDRATKLGLYAEAGVRWVWFLDSEARTVETLKLEGGKYYYDSVLSGNQILTSPLFPGWQLSLHELFDFRTSF